MTSRGIPVEGGAPTRFYGWWGEQSWFVDRSFGSDSNSGKQPTDAFQYLDTAIAAADAWDTIYVRPMTPDATDPGRIRPKATTLNWTIPNAKHGLSIIGAGPVIKDNSAINITHLRGAASATTGAVLDIKAPGCTVENIHWHDGAVGYNFEVISVAKAVEDIDSAYKLVREG